MTKPLFQVHVEVGVYVAELSFTDSLDAVEFDRLSDELLAQFDTRSHEKWVVDLSTITFLNSAGLGLLVNVRQRVKRGGGKLALCGLSPRVYELFHACSMERLFTLKRTRAEAMDAIA